MIMISPNNFGVARRLREPIEEDMCAFKLLHSYHNPLNISDRKLYLGQEDERKRSV